MKLVVGYILDKDEKDWVDPAQDYLADFDLGLGMSGIVSISIKDPKYIPTSEDMQKIVCEARKELERIVKRAKKNAK